MKKLLLILMILTLACLGCSNDDPNKTPRVTLTPPTWIQGTWANETYTFVFSERDISYTATIEENGLPKSFLFTTRYASSLISELETENEHWKHYQVFISNTTYLFGYNKEGNYLSYSFGLNMTMKEKGTLTK